jgi:hypothetical protein
MGEGDGMTDTGEAIMSGTTIAPLTDYSPQQATGVLYSLFRLFGHTISSEEETLLWNILILRTKMVNPCVMN